MHHRTSIALTLLLLVLSTAASAASILVNTADDELNSDGDCSLREALESANTGAVVDDCNRGDSGPDTVVILVSGTITLDSQIDINESITLQGPGRDILSVSGGDQTRVFRIHAPASVVAIQDMTIENGRTDDGFNGLGAGIRVNCVDLLKLKDVRMRNNEASGAGGALSVSINLPDSCGSIADLEVTRSVFEDNGAGPIGGALSLVNGFDTFNSAVIEDSVFSGNQAGQGGAMSGVSLPFLRISNSLFEANQVRTALTPGGQGGALYLQRPDSHKGTTLALIETSSFVFNFAGCGGGAISLDGALAAAVTNATIVGNNVNNLACGGTGISIHNDAALGLFFSTLHNNSSGVADDVALVAAEGASLSLNHTIVATDWATNDNCVATSTSSVTSNGYTLDSGSSCTGHADDVPATDPRLNPLSSWSQPGVPFDQLVAIPESDSPAVDRGASSNCPGLGLLGPTSVDIDQRGLPRPVIGPARGGDCDIGAIEFQPGDLPVIFHDRFEGAD